MNNKLKQSYFISHRDSDWVMTRVLGLDEPFTRSNGTVMARIYERLTKASRREQAEYLSSLVDAEEKAYRRGLYDAFKTLQEECA